MIERIRSASCVSTGRIIQASSGGMLEAALIEPIVAVTCQAGARAGRGCDAEGALCELPGGVPSARTAWSRSPPWDDRAGAALGRGLAKSEPRSLDRPGLRIDPRL